MTKLQAVGGVSTNQLLLVMAARARAWRAVGGHVVAMPLLLAILFFSAAGSIATLVEAADTDKQDSTQAVPLTLLTLPDDDTLLNVSRHIAEKLSRDQAVRILPTISRGSWQSVLDLLTLGAIDLAMIQLDHLEYASSVQLVPDVENKIVPLGTLGHAAVHVLAQQDIKNIQELQGKKVNFGPSYGGLLTAGFLFEQLDITVEAFELDFDEALRSLRSGDLDAAVFIGTVPIKDLQLINWETLLHLVPIPALGEPYHQVELVDRDYPGIMVQGESLSTVSIPILLAAYNWPKGSPRRDFVDDFVRDFRDNLLEWKLQGANRNLWRDANAARLPGWSRWQP